MRREGTDANNVQMTDVLCDFCHAQWTHDLPVIEGHQGSIICGNCLAQGYGEVVLRGVGSGPPGYTCTMCLERRPDRAWRSPQHPEAVACERCLNLAAGALEKDRDWNWRRPAASA